MARRENNRPRMANLSIVRDAQDGANQQLHFYLSLA
jgi:hypothetical protein